MKTRLIGKARHASNVVLVWNLDTKWQTINQYQVHLGINVRRSKELNSYNICLQQFSKSKTKVKSNKNAFQYDAYRLLVDPIP